MAVLDQPRNDPPTHSPIGFEGFEKRLEITFSPPPIFADPSGLGLRRLTRTQLDSILEPARCSIVAQLSSAELDSYVLSESSLFVYPLKIVLKTCGTTKLLSSIEPILQLAESLSLGVDSVKYSRGSFIFPHAQPAPYRNFADEVDVLNGFFGGLFAEAYVIGDPRVPNRNWHIYSAGKAATDARRLALPGVITLEICMTGLDKSKASVFFKKSGDPDYSAKQMTKLSGISEIIPGHTICDFDFDPCGYSMNGIEGAASSTVHVTPEEGFSYASYEAMGIDPESVKLDALVKRALRCFGPTEFSVAVTCSGSGIGAHLWAMVAVEGYTCERVVEQALPGGACLVYLTYAKGGSWRWTGTPAKSAAAKQCCREEAAEEEVEGAAAVAGDGVTARSCMAPARAGVTS
ncbi:S-adenosylmethionine decarboxylase proenzyme-like [Rhodamnia argentea]|uniref:adenosylmethionine decarboxylase n=1 Tax=Rhodamnia argentea TaxID=178133 RepID=A0A8B8PMG8_9MYRT|nr:S-adenosylmethionine decarboxylase proenzyme-like [Rhodamnia argentea]XP_048134249.1 S-adenosylmethionine decarboxylase proenzyme-like [Rhodamnia argentea]